MSSAPDPYGFDSLPLDWLRAKPGGKWAKYGGDLAAWVADMDFRPSAAIVDALHAVADTQDFGYPVWQGRFPSPAEEAFVGWSARRHGWHIDAADIVPLADVVQGLQLVLHTSTAPGDRVVVHTPAYPPFLSSVEKTGREVVRVPARRDATTPTGWAFDYDALDAELAARPAKVLMLSHPHNPTGHVFSEAELQRFADLAERHDLLILSDEIHADLTFAPHVHRPMALFAPTRTVTVSAPSKAFAMPGLRYAVAHFGSAAARNAIKMLPDHLLGSVSVTAVAASVAAWTQSDEWLAGVVDRLDANRHLVAELLTQHLPDVVYTPPASTYLAWLDCRALGLGDDPSQHFAARGVRLSEGPNFGVEGLGHVRLNFATAPNVLREIIACMAS
ncbi:MAG TPA: aminotransferase class I/II-fold pyridoxal phosphate-dependent enzyme [Ilumatobacteraceae bacterium]|nr:aminotransferase class I/II-fold pyridoxal phosphate-dependent enzyme [Ilumatobacteraceae bacterium]